MHAPPLRIGLTGGIASGKTAVANAFERRGVPVIDTDQLARDVVEPGRPALAAVVDAFGADVLDAQGRLDRRRVRSRVFADPAERRRLEGILHPAIRAELANRVSAVTAPYVVIGIPLLVENGLQHTVDRVLVVDVPRETQVARLLARDAETPAGAAAILAAQASREARLAVADDVITNTGTLAQLDDTVAALHARYLALAAAPRSPRNATPGAPPPAGPTGATRPESASSAAPAAVEALPRAPGTQAPAAGPEAPASDLPSDRGDTR